MQGKNKEAEAILLQAIAIASRLLAPTPTWALFCAPKGAMLTPPQCWKKRWNWFRMTIGCGKTWAMHMCLRIIQSRRTKRITGLSKRSKERWLCLPTDNQLLAALALNYANLSQKNDAMLALEKLSGPSAQTPDVLFNSALVYELVSERTRALSALQAAVRAGLPEARNPIHLHVRPPAGGCPVQPCSCCAGAA